MRAWLTRTRFAMNSDGRRKNRHSVHVHLQGLRTYQVVVLCFHCHQRTLGHGTRGTHWPGSRIRWRRCGNTEAANHLFNIREFRIYEATVWESVWTQFCDFCAGATGDIGTLLPSLTSAMLKAGKLQKLGCRHLDKTKPERLVNGKTQRTFEQEMT